MQKDFLFYRLSAIAAFTTALTTLLLWLLPKVYAPPANFDETLVLPGNVFYMLRQWINLLHIPLALLAYFALAYKLRKTELPQVGIGFVWFIIWGVTEMTGITTIVFAVNKNWRANYAGLDDAGKLIAKSNIENFYAVWDSMFFVLLIAFLLASAFYGWALWGKRGTEKILGTLFWLAVPLTLLIILSGYFDHSWAGSIVGWAYPALQPVSRFLLGLVLWKTAQEGESQRN